jgi:hypothetical protein
MIDGGFIKPRNLEDVARYDITIHGQVFVIGLQADDATGELYGLFQMPVEMDNEDPRIYDALCALEQLQAAYVFEEELP